MEGDAQKRVNSYNTLNMSGVASILQAVIVALLLSYTECIKNCRDLASLSYMKLDNEGLKTEILSSMDNLTKDANLCLEPLLRANRLEICEFYLNQLNDKGIRFKTDLKLAIASVKDGLDQFYNKYRLLGLKENLVHPALQWAQSMEDIYLRIKLSHRHDSPGCLDPIEPQIFRNVTHFGFQAYCYQDDDTITKYYVRFELFAGTNMSRPCELTKESVGKYQVIIPKSQDGFYWDKLQGFNDPLPPNLKFWLEMKEKLNDTHTYQWEDEEEEDKKQLEEMLSRKKTKKVKKEEKAEKKKQELAKKKKIEDDNEEDWEDENDENPFGLPENEVNKGKPKDPKKVDL